ncbi:hypothetical protein OROGR_023456 [Orobanche gracilis]
MDMSSDFDRILLLEHTRRAAESTYAKNPLDADNLNGWGGALLELSQFQNGSESKKMVQASELEPQSDIYKKSLELASKRLYSASGCDHSIVITSTTYSCTYILFMALKTPDLHVEIHKHRFAQQVTGQGPSASAGNKKWRSKKNKSDLKYDIFGWIILAVGIVAWVGCAKSNVPPPPQR